MEHHHQAFAGTGGCVVRFRQAPLTLLAGVTALIAAWPITTLVRGSDWVWDAVLVVALALGCAVLARAVHIPEFAVVWVQFVVVAGALWFLYVRGSGEPTVDTVRALITEADGTIRKYAAPAPETEGLRFAIVGLIAMLAVLTDVLAVGLAAPAVAGLPIMSIYLISAANTTDGLAPHYFLAAATGWLLMVGLTARGNVQRWSNTTARATAPTLLGDRLGLGGFASVARTVGLLALIGALVVPHVLPSTDQRYLGEGLGRRTGGTGSVGLSNTLDVSRSLVSNDRTPVITYSTQDPTPGPLRVFTSSAYNDGQWSQTDPADQQGGSDNARIQPAGLRPDAGYVEQSIRVESSTLTAGLLATPTPTLSVDLGGASWQYDPTTSVISPQRSVSQYSVKYALLGPSARPTSRSTPEGFERDLAIDPRALPELRRTLSRIEGGDNPFERAVAIQDYLRSGGGFTYSLTLAPTRRTVNDQTADPITNFLLTKQGYCVQFATAMIMLARLEQIPARMAIGFLGGSPSLSADQYTVIQSDAHAWPELYFPGLGWTRFEPTPGSRAASVPDYAVPQTSGPSRTERPEQTTPTTSADASTAPAQTSSATDSGGGTGSDTPSWFGTAFKYLGWLVLVALFLGLLGSFLPMAARREAERRRRTDDLREQVEADWLTFRDDLDDLGVPHPPDVSPRAQLQHYRRAGALGSESSQALDRATRTLEKARYGRADDDLDVRTDTAAVIEAVRRNAGFRHKLVHRFAPRTGRRWFLRKVMPWRKD